jgi:osmotically-inducible protein OsmY
MAQRDWQRDERRRKSPRDRDWHDDDRRARGRGPKRSERYSESSYFDSQRGRERDDDRNRSYGGERQFRDSRENRENEGYGRDRSTQTQPFDTTWSYYEFWLTPGPYTGRGPSGYRRNAERIKEDVCERLESHGDVDAQNIQVEADEQGEITLTGHVKSRREKRLADDIAESVRGVKDVHNQLRIRSEETSTATPWSNDPARTTGRNTAT